MSISEGESSMIVSSWSTNSRMDEKRSRIRRLWLHMCTQSCNKRRLHVPKADGCWDGSSASRWTNSVPELIAANDFQKKDTWRYPRLSRRLRAGTSCHALLPEHLTVQFGPQDVVFAGLVLHAPCSTLSCFQPTMIARDDP